MTVCRENENSDSKRERDEQDGLKGKENILRGLNDNPFPYLEKDGIQHLCSFFSQTE